MFKPARWRSEKKIKAVLKLQFQATQVPQLKAKTLTIALVPADVGKPTVRLEKAAIVDGSCLWENPVYETVKLVKELKTGRFNEKFYRFIVSTGSSKAGLLGEVSINFADYAEEAKPSTISLPIRTSKPGGSGAILHVTIQNMQGSADEWDTEEIEPPKAKPQDKSLKNQLTNYNRNENSNLNFTEDEYTNSVALDDTGDTGSLRNNPVDNPPIWQEGTTLIRKDSLPHKGTVNAYQKNGYTHQRSITDWSAGSASDGSMADLPTSPMENFLNDRSVEGSDRSIERLVREISMLERQASISELELQSLRKQIVKESKRGQDLSRQVGSLREERDALKTECEQLKSQLNCSYDTEVSNQLQIENQNLKGMLKEIRQELNHERDLKTTMRLQLQKTEDSNSKLIVAVRDLDEKLNQKNREIDDLSTIKNARMNEKEDYGDDPYCDNKAKEVGMLKQKITDLRGQIEVCTKEREELEINMEQLAIDHEILKQENHGLSLKLEQIEVEQIKMQNEHVDNLATIKELKLQIETLEKEILRQALELSESSDTIYELESRAKTLEEEMEKQAQRFQDDLEGARLSKIEQEQRAIQAEEALRKTRSNNAIAVEQIQEEFRRLSVEMSSKFDENEQQTMKAVTEANDLRLQKRVLEEMVQKVNKELALTKEQYEVKLQELKKQNDLKSKQIEQISQELKEKCMEIECLLKLEEEKSNSCSIEMRKLKGEIERLKIESDFSEESDCKEMRLNREQMKKPIGDKKTQRWSKEREELKRELTFTRKEVQRLQGESNTLRSLKDEKEIMVRILQEDVEKLRIQYNGLKNDLLKADMDKENPRKEVSNLEYVLQMNEEMPAVTEQQLQSDNKQARSSEERKAASLSSEPVKDAVSKKLNTIEDTKLAKKLTVNGRKRNLKVSEMSTAAGTSKQNGVGIPPVKREVETCSEKGQNVPNFLTSDDSHLAELLSEMAVLKERNKHMEGELKEMQERYSEISLKFAEVEGERQQLVMTVRNLKNNKKN